MRIINEITAFSLASYLIGLSFVMIFHSNGHIDENYGVEFKLDSSIDSADSECELCEMFFYQSTFFEFKKEPSLYKFQFQVKSLIALLTFKSIKECIQLRGPPFYLSFFFDFNKTIQ